MRYFLIFAAVAFILTSTTSAASASLNVHAFRTNAHFAVDRSGMTLSTAVATIEPRAGAPGYSWLRIAFYSFPPNAQDISEIERGDLHSMNERRTHSNADIQLTEDKNDRVWQVDMSVPGHACTIASTKEELERFFSTYRFDGKTLRLKSKGLFMCDMSSFKIPSQRFEWDIDLTTPVFRVHS